MLETSEFISPHTYIVLKNTPFSTKTPLNLLMSAFFAKNQHFGQSSTLNCVRDFLNFGFEVL